ncbi:AAA family ATPase [Chryseobacterium sp. EO14]|uniref:AAA family ATPase n=1 Tax=Chryseobacterium sp. EO14 TaxID=2950551 RepID=UPI00210D13D3|nr:AAA family ATPase [Chryseobacterium sp. EO14]MCQ4139492.1 AAA family ATPase [Chryseobacterium sp. EO14]
MEFIKNEDLKLIISCAGEEVNNIDFDKLKNVYSKLKHICDLLTKKGFKYEIRQDPRKQAGPGKFVFQDYQWAKVYPSEFYNMASDKFAYIIGFSDTVHFHLMGIKDFQYQKASTEASKKCWTEVDFENKNYEFVVDEFLKFDRKFKNLFIETGFKLGISDFKKHFEKINIDKNKKLLEYKKQIILQGPPGTGKTREAKLIAKELIGNNFKISEKNIFSFFTINQEILARKESTKYIIKEINQDSILLSTNGEDRSPTRKQIYDSYIGKLWEKSSEERKSNTLSYADALAKNLFNRFNDLKNNDQIKLIQFHPSYTYEDFVRGIVAESKGEKIEYKNVNKTLGEFAELALKNYQKSTKSDSLLSKNEWVNEQFDNFVETVQSKIDDTGEYRLTDKVKLFDIDESAFYYTGDSWFDSAKHRMKFSDIKEAFLSDPADKKAFKALANISGSAKQHYGYYYKVFSDFKNSITTKFKEVDTVVREPENFVLIIDEINRANLSSVLGELIYALEYRGEEVESMYSVDDSLLKNKLILPPNLYIIGTMNTADRSVGHIDYAIRRRFAFVEVLPKDLTTEMKDGEFYTDLFSAVKALFTKDEYQTNSDFISQEFEPKDVALGHSYFIDKSDDGGDVKIRWNYEIKPILLEYVRDGILKEGALEQITTIENNFNLTV